MRRGAPEALVAVLIALLLASYVVYTQRVVADLRRDAARAGTMYARIFQTITDPDDGKSTLALFDLMAEIRRQGVPLVITDSRGTPTGYANLDGVPEGTAVQDQRIRAWIARLDRRNPPVVSRDSAGAVTEVVHFGDTPVVDGLRIIPTLQALTAVLLLGFGAFVVRTRGHAARERVWAGMARESAHQLGTPLSSLGGWIELLEDRALDPAAITDPLLTRAVGQMRADMERLGRVANRFERIGREPRHETVDVDEIADRVATYFRARVPSRTNAIVIESVRAVEPAVVQGDAVLLEWAIEVLVKNAIDALSGRGGTVTLTTTGGARVRVRVADDGPGIPRELRRRVFDPGFTTKSGGWGIGLSLARRIVEDSHGGSIELSPAGRGAAFEIILRG